MLRSATASVATATAVIQEHWFKSVGRRSISQCSLAIQFIFPLRCRSSSREDERQPTIFETMSRTMALTIQIDELRRTVCFSLDVGEYNPTDFILKISCVHKN